MSEISVISVAPKEKNDSGEYVCSECNTVFTSSYYALRRHVKKYHEGKMDEIAPLKHPERTFSCQICGKKFKYSKHLTFHKKSHEVLTDSTNKRHTATKSNKSGKECPLCSYKESSKTQLCNHFKEVHGVDISIEKLEFATKGDFEVWKNLTERSSKSRYVKECGDVVYETHRSLSYICHRSGFYVSTGQKKRHLKTQGSCKIEGFCPSGMKVTVNSTGQYQVSYIKTHVGHTVDLAHLNLTDAEREEIAKKIALKIPFAYILDEIRDNISEDSLERVHILNKKDLHNITAAYNLQCEAVRHPNDAVSIEAWVNAMKDSQCVLFYKCQNTIVRYPGLKSEDFVLIIMNDGQLQMLEKFSSDCVCIDGTHGLNAYNFELHTLLVIDDLRQGFPAAFMVSNRADQEVMTLFFSCIKDRLNGNAITPRVFMSDMTDSYYNAWKRVMGEPTLRLFCTWHIDRAWRKNLNLVDGKEKQVEIYKILRTLLHETDETAFLTMLAEFSKLSSEEQHTSKFAVYFKNNYEKNLKSWAYCYRLHSGLNTNMHLERIHKTIKYIYLDGKHTKRLDKSINAIMRFVKDKLFDRVIALHKGKISTKLKDLRKRHKTSLELDPNLMNELDGGWQIISSSSNPPQIYEVRKNVEQCGCQLLCTDCNFCIHKYSCSSLDSSIRWNMCKHIHLLGRKMLDQIASTEVSVQMEINDDDENLYLHIDNRKAEVEDLHRSLVTGCSTNPPSDNTLQQTKEDIRRWMNTVLDSIQSHSQMALLKKLIAPIEPTLKAAASRPSLPVSSAMHVPSNKKIDKQRRLYSTKKKSKKIVSLQKPSTEEQNEIAMSLLNSHPE